MRTDLTPKMIANLERVRDGGNNRCVLHVGAAEHLVERGLISKCLSPGGHGRAKALYQITDSGRAALCN